MKPLVLATAALLAAVSAVPLAQQTASPPASTQPAVTGQAQPEPAGKVQPGASGQTQQRPPSFSSVIDLVSLNVTVADSAGHYVTDLDEGEFLVFENGVKQNVTFFSRRHSPIALVMLLDSSASMEYKLPTLQQAAANFVKRLRPNDLAAIVDFDGRVEIRQSFTSNQADLIRGIQLVSAGGSTALHNAVYISLKELKKIPATSGDEPRRQALIVFSDGQDTASLVSYDEVLDTAKRSETAIYTIGLRDEHDTGRGFKSADYVLRQLSLETGGRAYFAKSVDELNSVYAQIADELSSQYSLGYTSSNPRRDGLWRPIVVRLSRPGLVARTKTGYFAPSR